MRNCSESRRQTRRQPDRHTHLVIMDAAAICAARRGVINMISSADEMAVRIGSCAGRGGSRSQIRTEPRCAGLASADPKQTSSIPPSSLLVLVNVLHRRRRQRRQQLRSLCAARWPHPGTLAATNRSPAPDPGRRVGGRQQAARDVERAAGLGCRWNVGGHPAPWHR